MPDTTSTNFIEFSTKNDILIENIYNFIFLSALVEFSNSLTSQFIIDVLLSHVPSVSRM